MTHRGPIPALAAFLLFLALTNSSARAQNSVGANGLCVTITYPVSTPKLTDIRSRIENARRDTNPPTRIVFDFNPNDQDAHANEFGSTFELTKLIAGITDITTIGFVHGKVSGQAVWPVLACTEIVMSPSAKIGEIVAPDAPRPDADQTELSLKRVRSHRPGQEVLIQKMFDPDVVVMEGKDKNGTVYFDLAKRKEFEAAGGVVQNNRPIVPGGRVVLYSATQARELGLCRAFAQTRADLADLYGLSPATLRDDPRGTRPVKAFKLVIHGDMDQGKRESIVRSLNDVVRQNGTIVFLQIDGGGGSVQAAADLAADLRGFQQSPEDGLFLVGFVPSKAADTGTIIALGCTEIVMTARKNAAGSEDEPEAEIGDFDAVLNRGPGANGPLQQSLTELAQAQHYSTLLVQGMVDPDLEIVRVHKKTDPSIRRLMTKADFDAQKADWVQDEFVKNRGETLKLSATEAAKLGVARFTVDTKDITAVYEKYGVDPTKVAEVTPGWLDRFTSFLKIPSVTVLLAVIGFTGLILELKVPGTTIPGIIAALCFILLFWAYSRYSGQVAILAGLIFLLGLILILMEVFVIPGFGATGVLGILFMLAGLGLLTFEKIPQTGAEWGLFGVKVLQYLVGMMVAGLLAVVVAKFLPRIPYANRMVLTPPTETPDAERPEMIVPGAAQASGLLGAVGTAVTVLRPAGAVRFGDQYVDVVTDGGYVQAGARVRVIEVEGNRIVVKEV
jgi:membrane-bound ClpP family serine protease